MSGQGFSGVASGRVAAGRVRGAEMFRDDRGYRWSRYVALGDSFTEGVGDPEFRSPGGLRGWADRVAEELAAGRKDFSYANLAVRGLLLEQILNQQITRALALEPDLITLSAGGNDMVFHGSDPDKLATKLDAGVRLLNDTQATIVLFTGPDWGSTPVLGRNRSKVAIFNENVHAIALQYDAVVADLWALRTLRDPRMWDPDRLHLSPPGHHTVAMTVLEALGAPHTLLPLEPKDLPERNWRQKRVGDLAWASTYLFPWALRQVRPRGTEEKRSAKRPDPGPILAH
jgi:lysophospholipase L1-like esterase